MQTHVHYIPSFYGDVRLEKINESSCKVITERVTEREKQALDKLLEVASKKGWLMSPAGSLYGTNTLKAELQAPIDKVARQLARLLKPNRKVITAVRFADGHMEEVVETDDGDDRPRTAFERVADEVKHEKPAVAATVAAPIRGCPAPHFGPAELRAQGVLAAFLNAEQLEDFRLYNRFVAIGAGTGTRYMITSRQSKDQLARWQRTLYDLDDDRPLCVHDWSVPAAEEMLSLHLLLAIPHWEAYLRKEEHDVELDPEQWAQLSRA